MIDAGLSATLLNQGFDNKFDHLKKAAAGNESQAALKAKEFESMFIAQMLEGMFGESVGVEAFGDSDTFEIYKGLMMDAYGKEIANAGGIGIAGYVQTELLRLQEAA